MPICLQIIKELRMHTQFPHWTGVLWYFPCVPCVHTQCSCAIIQGGSQMAVCSMAGDVKFSHHALNFFSLKTISGGYAFINPHSHIKLVLNPLLSSSPKKKKKIPFFSSCSWSTPNRMWLVLPLELTLDRLRAPRETTGRSRGSSCLRKFCISESAACD